MPLWNLSYEKVEDIKEKRKKKQLEYDKLEKTAINDIWVEDIDRFLVELEKVEEQEKIDRKKEDQQMKKNFGKGKVQKAKKKNVVKKEKKQKGYDWDSDEETDQSAFGDKKKATKKGKQEAKPTAGGDKKVKK